MVSHYNVYLLNAASCGRYFLHGSEPHTEEAEKAKRETRFAERVAKKQIEQPKFRSFHVVRIQGQKTKLLVSV